MSKHTPTPWRVSQEMYGIDNMRVEGVEAQREGYVEPVANCGYGAGCAENAAHIVKCVNAHDALVEALEALMPYVPRSWVAYTGINLSPALLDSPDAQAAIKARAALALAKGSEGVNDYIEAISAPEGE